MMDAAHEKKITVDVAALQRILGVPVVSTTATSGGEGGVRHLAEQIRKAQVADLEAIAQRLRGGEEPQREPLRACGGCGGCGKC